MRPRIGVDVGGTFTDVTLVTEDGDLVTAKVPSTPDQSEGVLAGIQKACDEAGIEPNDLREFTHAMTVSVNALLERTGAKTALVTTEGFRDVLEIGRQDRPALYDLDAEKSEPLVPRSRRYELTERATPDGVREAVDESQIQEISTELQEENIESVAVALLHAYATPENERQVTEVLREELDVPVSTSHEVLAEFREFERTATTAVDSYITPSIDSYVGRLAEQVTEAGIPEPRIMQSNGGIADAETVREHAVTTILSGPAAGVVGAGRIARPINEDGDLDSLVTFDMGGTSSDVSVVRDGNAERTTNTVIDGLPIRVPMVDIHTIGSGGGSVAWLDSGGALRVGPRSAGADPGPACYGRGATEPTVTDANVVLGYVGGSTALGGELELNVGAAEDALADLAAEAGLDSPLDAAQGVYRVANAKMTQAIREVTVEQGYDPRSFGLVSFGGAGPMHAVSIAENLGIGTVIIPVAAGVLSSYGLLDADERYDRVRTHLVQLAEAEPDTIEGILADLAADARADVTGEDVEVEYAADLRYDGQSFELTVPVEAAFDPDMVRERFHAAHERTYGYQMDAGVELVSLRVTARSPRSVTDTAYEGSGDSYLGTREAHFAGDTYETAIHDRLELEPGATVDGPAVFEQDESTTVVPPGWATTVRPDGTLLITGES